jgi:hypothetical protein
MRLVECRYWNSPFKIPWTLSIQFTELTGHESSHFALNYFECQPCSDTVKIDIQSASIRPAASSTLLDFSDMLFRYFSTLDELYCGTALPIVSRSPG